MSSRPLKLYIVGVRWPPETVTRRKLNGLADAGIHVTICASITAKVRLDPKFRFVHLYSSTRSGMIASIGAFLMKLMRYPLETARVWQKIRPDFASKRLAFRYLLQIFPFIGERPDIVHFEWNSAAVAYLPIFDVFDCPIVISCRGAQINVAPHNPHRQNYVDSLRQTLTRATAVHCVSDDIKGEAMKYGLVPEKAWVIRPAVDPEFFYPSTQADRRKQSLTVISTGSMIWRKGYEYAIMAIRLLVDAGVDVEYKIIGDGPEHQRVLYTIHDLHLENHVQLIGSLSPEQVRDHLQKADVFLLSSLSEGISNAVLEAMACGLPVVTTDCGGMREAVTDGVEGFVVPVRDVVAMAARMREIHCDQLLRQKMGRLGRERIVRHFALQQQVQDFADLYNSSKYGSSY